MTEQEQIGYLVVIGLMFCGLGVLFICTHGGEVIGGILGLVLLFCAPFLLLFAGGMYPWALLLMVKIGLSVGLFFAPFMYIEARKHGKGLVKALGISSLAVSGGAWATASFVLLFVAMTWD